jgi:hypothetical protein
LMWPQLAGFEVAADKNPGLFGELERLRKEHRKSKTDFARIESVYRAVRSRDSFKKIARDSLIRRSRAFVARAVSRAATHGVKSLLGVKHGGFRSTCALISPDIGGELTAQIKSKALRSSAQIRTWLRLTHGVHITTNGLYAWLRRHCLRIGKPKKRKYGKD